MNESETFSGTVVSSDAEDLILVTPDDEEIGHLSKGACHDGDGVLHRAFSLFVFNDDGALLLQRRAADKRLWPGYWSNSCCSHPRAGETVAGAVERRAAEELHLQLADIRHLYKFQYHADFGDAGAEHELCWVFAARAINEPRPNPLEIDDWDWWLPNDLDAAMAAKPDRFTPWFRQEWAELRRAYGQALNGYGV